MNELIVNQDALSNACDTIETYLNELDLNITHLTNGLDEEWNHINAQDDEDSSLNSCDVDRENTFTLVTQLEYQLLKMQSRVNAMNEQYNSQSNSMDNTNPNHTIPQIVNILEHFQNSIDYLSTTSKNLQKEVNKIKNDMF